MKAIILLLLIASLALADETNSTLIIKTNRVKSVDSFRVVDGQLYNTKKSVLWGQSRADFISGDGISAKVQMFRIREIYGAAQTDSMSRVGLFPSKDPMPAYRPVIDRVREDGAVVILRNYSPGEVITEGSSLDFSAMKVGTTNISRKNYELWDCGLPNYVQVITTNASRRVGTNSAARKLVPPPQP